MNKIVTMQDISCIGKCSLTVALPVLSAMGIETAILPTAVLSTHTMFHGFTFHDLTNEILPILQHWKSEGFQFQAIYTGYLGSSEQLDIASYLIDSQTNHPLVIIDPCMADSGKLYTGFTDSFVEGMKKLTSKADIICPNLTEAFLLTNQPYQKSYTEQQIQKTLKQLCQNGPKTAIITGISFTSGKIGAYAYNSVNDTWHSYFTEEETQHFHGTGDIWASCLTGALVNGKTLDQAIQIACDFVKLSIQKTLEEKNHNIYGVNFEQALGKLIEMSKRRV